MKSRREEVNGRRVQENKLYDTNKDLLEQGLLMDYARMFTYSGI